MGQRETWTINTISLYLLPSQDSERFEPQETKSNPKQINNQNQPVQLFTYTCFLCIKEKPRARLLPFDSNLLFNVSLDFTMVKAREPSFDRKAILFLIIFQFLSTRFGSKYNV